MCHKKFFSTKSTLPPPFLFVTCFKKMFHGSHNVFKPGVILSIILIFQYKIRGWDSIHPHRLGHSSCKSECIKTRSKKTAATWAGMRIVFSKKRYLDDSNTKQECLYASCKQAARFTYLHHSMMDGCVLFLLQHHQGDDDHCRYDNTAHHEPNDGTFVGTHIFCKEHLENKSRKRIVTTGDVWMRNVKSFSISSLHFMP